MGDVAGGDAGGGGGGGVPSGLPFQVGYREAGQEYTLYLLAAREQDRAEWIRAIRAGKSPICRSTCFLLGYLTPFNRNLVSWPTFPLAIRPPIAILINTYQPRACDIRFDISRRIQTSNSR